MTRFCPSQFFDNGDNQIVKFLRRDNDNKIENSFVKTVLEQLTGNLTQ